MLKQEWRSPGSYPPGLQIVRVLAIVRHVTVRTLKAAASWRNPGTAKHILLRWWKRHHRMSTREFYRREFGIEKRGK